MITLTEKEKNTLAILGKRYKGKTKEIKEYTIPKNRPINEIFCANNGAPSPHDYFKINYIDE